MNENNNNVVMLEEEESAFDFRQLGQLCLSNWYWIVMPVKLVLDFGLHGCLCPDRRHLPVVCHQYGHRHW